MRPLCSGVESRGLLLCADSQSAEHVTHHAYLFRRSYPSKYV